MLESTWCGAAMSPNNSRLILGLVTPWENSHPELVASCPPLISSNQTLCYALCRDLAPRLSQPGSTLREYLSLDGSYPCLKPCSLRWGKNRGMFCWCTSRRALRRYWWEIGEVERPLGPWYMAVCWSQVEETVTETWHLHSWDLNSSWGWELFLRLGAMSLELGFEWGYLTGGARLRASSSMLGKLPKRDPWEGFHHS